MTDLVRVGRVLQIAYAAAGKHNCLAKITEVLSKYQTLVSHTNVGVNTFVKHCTVAVHNHCLALKAVAKNKPELVLKQLSKCATMASEMAATAGKIAEKAEELTGLSEKALIATVEDQTKNASERKELEKRKHTVEASQARMKTTADQLVKNIAAAEQVHI